MRSTQFAYDRVSEIRTGAIAETPPLFQGYPNCIMDWVKYRDGSLVAEISLGVDVSTTKTNRVGTGHTKNMSMAICLLLS